MDSLNTSSVIHLNGIGKNTTELKIIAKIKIQ